MADPRPSFMTGKTESDSSSGSVLQDLKQLKNKRTSFNENSEYRIDNLSYPIDLLSNNTDNTGKYPKTGGTEYGSNYVVFYINVNESSKLLVESDQWYGNKVVQNFTPNDASRISGQGITAGEAAVGIGLGTAVEGGTLGAIVGGNAKGAALGAAGGGIAGVVGAGVIMTQTGAAKSKDTMTEIKSPAFSKQMKRLVTAIALHTPNQFTTRYGMNWNETDTDAFQLAMRGGETLGKAISDYATGNVSNVSEPLKSMASAIMLKTSSGREAVSAITGLAPNPKKEQIFKSVDFRTFQFEYNFFPKSKQEYQNVQNIIYLFKLHMHPEYKDTGNFLYLYPSEFDIVHYSGIDENFNLPRHTSCALSELSINYSPQGQFTSFDGGAPTQINIVMTFKELSQLSKERIQEGF